MKAKNIREGSVYAASFNRIGGWGKPDDEATYFPVRAVRKNVLRGRAQDGVLVEYLDDTHRPEATVEVIDSRAIFQAWSEFRAKEDERERHLLDVQMELASRGIGSTLSNDGITITGVDTENLLKSMAPPPTAGLAVSL